jgi:hypothetical protein
MSLVTLSTSITESGAKRMSHMVTIMVVSMVMTDVPGQYHIVEQSVEEDIK